jgi:hypothetical protein
LVPPIDLPLREQQPVVETPPPLVDTVGAREVEPARGSGVGLAIGMLVLGLLVGFGGGFVIGQRLSVPPPPQAVEVPRPAPIQATPPIQTTPPIQMAFPAPVAPAQNVPPSPVVEAPLAIQEPEVDAEPAAPVARTPSGARRADKAPPAARPATVRFDSRPPGATIYLGEMRLGVTPLTVTTVTPGTHQVRMEMLGHNTWRSSVTVKEGEQVFVGASLE